MMHEYLKNYFDYYLKKAKTPYNRKGGLDHGGVDCWTGISEKGNEAL